MGRRHEEHASQPAPRSVEGVSALSQPDARLEGTGVQGSNELPPRHTFNFSHVAHPCRLPSRRISTSSTCISSPAFFPSFSTAIAVYMRSIPGLRLESGRPYGPASALAFLDT
jgi:hypothetical protein